MCLPSQAPAAPASPRPSSGGVRAAAPAAPPPQVPARHRGARPPAPWNSGDRRGSRGTQRSCDPPSRRQGACPSHPPNRSPKARAGSGSRPEPGGDPASLHRADARLTSPGFEVEVYRRAEAALTLASWRGHPARGDRFLRTRDAVRPDAAARGRARSFRRTGFRPMGRREAGGGERNRLLRLGVRPPADDPARCRRLWRDYVAAAGGASVPVAANAAHDLAPLLADDGKAPGGNLTTGVVTGLNGIGDDLARFQNGSSGSPAMDRTGGIVGMASSILADDAFAPGEFRPQDVNFAVCARSSKRSSSSPGWSRRPLPARRSRTAPSLSPPPRAGSRPRSCAIAERPTWAVQRNAARSMNSSGMMNDPSPPGSRSGSSRGIRRYQSSPSGFQVSEGAPGSSSQSCRWVRR